jgi:hypothetical protein
LWWTWNIFIPGREKREQGKGNSGSGRKGANGQEAEEPGAGFQPGHKCCPGCRRQTYGVPPASDQDWDVIRDHGADGLAAHQERFFGDTQVELVSFDEVITFDTTKDKIQGEPARFFVSLKLALIFLGKLLNPAEQLGRWHLYLEGQLAAHTCLLSGIE